MKVAGKRAVNLLVLSSAWFLVGCAISTAPPRSRIAQPNPQVPISYAAVGAKISVPALTRHINRVTAPNFRSTGQGSVKKAGITVCEYSWEVQVSRTPMLVRPIAEGLSVKSTFEIWGRVRGTGRLCKNFRETTQPTGIATVTLSTRPTIDPLYALEPRFDYTWKWERKPAIRLVKVIPIRFGTLAGEAIEKGLRKARDQYNADFKRELNFQSQVRSAWTNLHSTIPVGAEQPIWLSIKPLSLHRSPLKTDTEFARMYVGLRSKNEMVAGTKPADQDVVALPILQNGTAAPGFALTTVARIGYQAAQDAARQQWAGKVERFDRGEIRFIDFRAYQSGTALVIGTKIAARSKIGAAVSGWLYLAGEPYMEGTVLRLRNIRYAANTNNPVVQFAAWLFQENVRSGLEEKLRVDLHDPLKDATDKVNSLPPTSIGGDTALKVQVASIAIGTPVADASDLLIPISAIGEAEAIFTPFEATTSADLNSFEDRSALAQGSGAITQPGIE